MRAAGALLAALALATALTRPAAAEELSLAEIAQRALRENLAVARAERVLREAEADLKGEPRLKNSALSLGGDYRYTFEDGEGSLGAEAEVSLPLSPQLELEGQISGEAGDRLADMAKQVALTAYPFAPTDPRYPREKAYGLAEAALRFLRVQIALQAQQAALDLQARGMERELARRTLELEDRKSALAELRLARGEISFQDAQDQRVALSEARRRLFDSELAALRDWKTLQVLFAPGTDDVALAPLSLGELREFVAARAARLAALRRQAPSSQKLETLRLELAALRAEWGATPVFRPDTRLSAAAGRSGPASGSQPYVSLSFSFSLSPSQRRQEDRLSLQQDIAEQELVIAAEAYALELERRLGVQSIAIAEQALAAALLQQERDTLAAREAELLFQQGRRTVLERDQLGLNVERARIQCYRAAVDLYGAQGTLLLLYPESPPAR
jgi:hypothetical protein